MSTSTHRLERAKLIAALSAAMREVSGLGVLFSQAAAGRLGVGSTDLECMGYLVDGPKTAGELAEATGLTTGAITGVIDRLERAGFARRERDADDRRRVMVRLTAEAARRSAPIFGPMERATVEALASYRDDQLALLLDFVTRTRDGGAAVLASLLAEEPPRKPPKKQSRAIRRAG